MENFHTNNHYVPQSYLKRWSVDGSKIWSYPILVSLKNVPLWKLYSIRGIGYQKHLYTRVSMEHETDEIECWFEREFETPAEEALEKATTNRRLKEEDWIRLIRFAAAQFVRTPANLSKTLVKWQNDMPELLNNTIQKTVKELEVACRTGKLPETKKVNHKELIPIQISTEPMEDNDKSLLKVETLVGRRVWLFSIRHILTKTVNVLLQHRWSILHAVPGFEWVTSDDPVICLNYYGENSYDFHGGWGNKGSEIILPLSPQHILYTKVGDKRPFREELTLEFCTLLQKIIAEHAHRWIFAKEPLKDIEKFHPRKIDEITFKHEIEVWSNWHDEQSSAEREYK